MYAQASHGCTNRKGARISRTQAPETRACKASAPLACLVPHCHPCMSCVVCVLCAWPIPRTADGRGGYAGAGIAIWLGMTREHLNMGLKQFRRKVPHCLPLPQILLCVAVFCLAHCSAAALLYNSLLSGQVQMRAGQEARAHGVPMRVMQPPDTSAYAAEM